MWYISLPDVHLSIESFRKSNRKHFNLISDLYFKFYWCFKVPYVWGGRSTSHVEIMNNLISLGRRWQNDKFLHITTSRFWNVEFHCIDEALFVSLISMRRRHVDLCAANKRNISHVYLEGVCSEMYLINQ